MKQGVLKLLIPISHSFAPQNTVIGLTNHVVHRIFNTK